MNIREAILEAADSIEQYPELFYFGSIANPDFDCGTPGCALGWIAFHCGITKGIAIDRFSEVTTLLGFGPDNDDQFYDRMTDIHCNWRNDAPDCASALRKYADKYHPKSAIPASVLAIFEVTETVQ